MVNKVIYVGFRGGDRPNRPLPGSATALWKPSSKAKTMCGIPQRLSCLFQKYKIQ